ncbi:uncharacterized protein LOC125238560 isoform X2 [Leguminivora glycinivorella]|uniref:uncharacterized protein LOC125238560 isoform X2 n=1 Tax=Leguminivora glycinivorella TaxID=1035111 RepID=UPI00200F31C4|nr:uncharacterized protein LOC125238560 isoform X2 [Leguminivora glycinivorella]
MAEELNVQNLEDAELNELLKNGNPQELRNNLLDMLNDSGLTEEMKENLRNMLSGNTPKVLGGSGPWLGVLFAALIFSVILFFGYKLYKSIKDKEVKREEKKKAKQMKKKK